MNERDERAIRRGDGRWRNAPPIGRAGREPAAPVLVVDDDAVCAELMASALERDGHRVEWTTDPPHALALVRARPYAAIVSDVNMPGMSGIALAAEVRKCRPGLPTLLVTGVAHRGVQAQAEAVGCALLAKPVRVEVLCSAVRQLLNERVEERTAP